MEDRSRGGTLAVILNNGKRASKGCPGSALRGDSLSFDGFLKATKKTVVRRGLASKTIIRPWIHKGESKAPGQPCCVPGKRRDVRGEIQAL